MKIFATIVIGLTITNTTLCSERASDTAEEREDILRPSEYFVTADSRLFEHGGVNENARILCKRNVKNGRYRYIGNHGSVYWATTETLIRAISLNVPDIITIILNERLINLNDAKKEPVPCLNGYGRTPLRYALSSSRNETLVPLLIVHGALVHNPPHHTAYKLIIGFLNDQFTSPRLIETLLRRGITHCSRSEKYWLTYSAQQTYEDQTELAIRFWNNQSIREQEKRARDVLNIVKTLVGPVSEEDRYID